NPRTGALFVTPLARVVVNPDALSEKSFRALSELKESEGDSLGGWNVIQDAGWDWGPAWMARPYSTDLRERVVKAVDGGLSRRQAASFFGVAISTVIEWAGAWGESGSWSPKPMGGDHSSRWK